MLDSPPLAVAWRQERPFWDGCFIGRESSENGALKNKLNY
jgi:hypothetical protein